MHVGAPLQQVGGGLDDGDHAGTDASVLVVGPRDQLVGRFPGRSREATQQLPVMEEVRAQQLGDGEDPLRMTDLLEDLVAQQGTEDGGPFRRTGRTESSPGAGEGHQVLGSARVTVDAGEATLEVTTGPKGQDHVVNRASLVAVGAAAERARSI